MLTTPPTGPILAIAAHPDDIESWCAGTLVQAIDGGATVHLLLVTSGDRGSTEPEAVARQREQEAATAASHLGIAEVTFLHYGDGEMENTIELRRDLVVAIRRWRPHAIFTHDPEQTLPPDYYVDIRAGLERKIEARLLHVSQTVDGDALRVGWRKRAAAIGEAAGLVAAEAFTVLTVD